MLGWLKGLKKDKKGAIGIEILIVFIAIVLVAAVSAAVLIQTVGYLQQKATATGRETTQEVASGIKVIQVLGHVDNPKDVNGKIDKLAILVECNTGGQDIDLNKTTISITDGTKHVVLTYNQTYFNDTGTYSDLFNVTCKNNKNLSVYPAALHFGVIVLQDPDKSLTSSYPVLNAGDKVVLTINASKIFNGISPRTKVSGEVRPEFGAPGIIQFTTPPAYTQSVIELQ